MFDFDIDDRTHRRPRRDREDRTHRRSRHDRDDRARRDDNRGARARRWRGRHRHIFAWAVLGGGTLAVGLLLYGILSALGVTGLLAQAYFGVALAVLPATWHDELQALPGIVHVLLVAGALGLIAALAGEVLD